MHATRAGFVIVLVSFAASARAQVSLVSTSSGGANFSGDLSNASASADGRYVAFEAEVSGAAGVYVKDRQSGALTPASVAAGGSIAWAFKPSISADGSTVAFHSHVQPLIPGDTNLTSDIYVRDLAAAITTRVSVSSAGIEGDGVSTLPSVGGNGRYVAFQSYATNLVAGDTNGQLDVFVHDRATATTSLASVSAAGGSANGVSRYPAISGDGRWIAFESTADDLVLPDNFAGGPEVYARDLINGTTVRVSLSSAGAQLGGSLVGSGGIFGAPCGALSFDGRWVAFLGGVGLDSAHPTAGGLYLRDLLASATRLVTVPPAGAPQTIDMEGGSMSSDGRFVAYSTRERITPDDLNYEADVYVRDMSLGTQTRVSPELPGQINGVLEHSGNAFVIADGSAVFFESWSRHLSPTDMDSSFDVYAFDWALAAPVAYCNAGVSSQGCAAVLTASGSPSGSAGSGFVLTVSATDGQRTGLLAYGISGRQSLPWGSSSFACVTPPRQRTGLLSTGGTSGACDGAFGLDWNAYVAAHPFALGTPVAALTPIQVQAFVRDPGSAGGSVLSNALEFYAVP